MTPRMMLRWVEYAWHAAVILVLIGAFIPMLRQTTSVDSDPLAGDPITRAVLLAAFGISILILVLQFKASIYIVLKSPWPWLMVGWLFLSALWSTAPDVSVRRAAGIALATLYSMVLFIQLDFQDLWKVLAIVFVIALAASLIAVVVYPSWAIMSAPNVGAWRGVFLHKNVLGRIAVLSILLFVTLLRRASTPGARVLFLGMLAFSFFMLLKSRSATGYVVAAVVVAGSAALLIFERWRRHWLILALAGVSLAVIVGIALLDNYNLVFRLLGKNSTLTGRVPLWRALIAMAEQHRWLGYGFGAFWLGWRGPSAQIWALFWWLPPHAHNGYLDLWLELGLIGLALVLGLLAFLLLRAWQMILARVEGGRFWFLFLIFVFVVNLPETTLLESATGKIIYWVLLAYFCFAASFRSQGEGRQPYALSEATTG